MPLPDAGFIEYAIPGKYGMTLSSMFWKYDYSPYIPLQIILVNLHWQKNKLKKNKLFQEGVFHRSLFLVWEVGKRLNLYFYLPMLHCDIFQDISIKYL